MARIKSGWLRLVRDYHELLVWARKLEARDPQGSVILRLWAEAKAWALAEVEPGTAEGAARALRDAGRPTPENSGKNSEAQGSCMRDNFSDEVGGAGKEPTP